MKNLFKKLVEDTIQYLQQGWSNLDKMNGYWISPKGKIVRVNSSHSTELYTNAEVYRKLGVPVSKFNDGNDMVNWQIRNGWVQIRLWGDFITATVYRLNTDSMKNLALWALIYPNKEERVEIEQEYSHGHSISITVEGLLTYG